jgi:hydroxymethylpyrimidine/phosphomethylpyrimidine kinase
MLSAAIAAGLANGCTMVTAVDAAKDHVTRSLASPVFAVGPL